MEEAGNDALDPTGCCMPDLLTSIFNALTVSAWPQLESYYVFAENKH